MSDQRRNRLGEEKSPYLQQHRSNPVWWQPWGREAFDTARELDLPVFLSVGYSTCHWCHVMERESFEDEGVAEVLNRGFVSIKVDREERPDVDALYMDAVHAFGQRGGWPMSVWMTPEAKPFAAGTYFPREHFVGILQNITEAWRGGQRQQIEEQGRALIDALVNSRARERAGGLDESLLVDFLGEWTRAFDPRHGGRQGAPKFPPAWDLQLLMRVARRLVDPAGRDKALEIVRVTLDRMAASGTYDQLGGGFHRYSTDERWLVPHFEKMLYDQASLTLAYVDAWQLTGDEEYALVARETCDYVLRDMTHPNGGFYSAEDADSEGEEGLFYVWHEDELKRLLREEELARLEEEFTISAGGNFERGANILAAREGRTRKARPPELKAIMTRLFEHRATRPRPHLDDKILTDWNGLMITAMARAGRALREPRYVEGAKSAARFVLERLVDDEGRLMHRWREDEAAIAGTLDDHAFLVEALIELYQATFDTSFIERALELDERMHALFAEEGTGDLHLTDGSDEVLPMRRVELFDNVVPAGRSVAAHNALRLAELSGDAARAERAQAIFAATPALASQHPGAFARLLAALDHALDRAKAVALIGPPGAARDAMLAALEEGYHPNRLVALGEKGREPGALGLLEGREAGDGEVLAHVCEEGICQLPTDDPAKAAELAAAHEPLPSPGR